MPPWANATAGDRAAGREGGPESPHLGAGCCSLRLPPPPSLPPPDPLQLIKLFKQSLCICGLCAWHGQVMVLWCWLGEKEGTAVAALGAAGDGNG